MLFSHLDVSMGRGGDGGPLKQKHHSVKRKLSPPLNKHENEVIKGNYLNMC